MIRTSLSSLLVLLVVSPLASGQFGGGDNRARVSQTIAVRGDEIFVPLSDDALEAAVSQRTIGEIGKAVAEENGIDAEWTTASSWQISPLESGAGIRLYYVACYFPQPSEDSDGDDKLVAARFAVSDRIISHLEEVLQRFQDEETDRRKKARRQTVDELKVRGEQLREQWGTATTELIEAESSGGESAEALRDQLTKLRNEVRMAEFNQVRTIARREAIEKQIERIKKSTEDKSKEIDAAIVEELEQALAVRERAGEMRIRAAEAKILGAEAELEEAKAQLARVTELHGNGSVSSSELAEAKMMMNKGAAVLDMSRAQLEQQRATVQQELAEARVAMLTARRAQGATQGNAEMAALNKQLTQIAIELDESMATRDVFRAEVEKLRDELAQRVNRELSLELLRQEVDRMRQQLKHVDIQRMEAELTRVEPRTPVSVRVWGE